MGKAGTTTSLVIATFLLFGLLLQAETPVMGTIALAALVVLVAAYEFIRRASGEN